MKFSVNSTTKQLPKCPSGICIDLLEDKEECSFSLNESSLNKKN